MLMEHSELRESLAEARERFSIRNPIGEDWDAAPKCPEVVACLE